MPPTPWKREYRWVTTVPDQDPEYWKAFHDGLCIGRVLRLAPLLRGILGHHLDGQMQFHRVSRDINSSRFTERPAPIVNSL